MRNQLTVAEANAWNLFDALGHLDDIEVNVSAYHKPSPRVSVRWGAISVHMSSDAAQVLGQYLLLAAQATRAEVSHD